VWWAIQPSLNYVFIMKFGNEKKIKIGEHSVFTSKKVDCLVCPVCLAVSCLKMKNWPDNSPITNKLFLLFVMLLWIIFHFNV